MTLDNTPGTPDFSRDGWERSGKTLLQTAIAYALTQMPKIEELLTGTLAEDANLFLFVPAISAGLSWVTSWLSRYKGSPDTASLID